MTTNQSDLTTPVVIRTASGAADMQTARCLFIKYAESLGFSLCFQGFTEELAELPGCYSEPAGVILFACNADAIVGCIGLRPLADQDHCEMKRLYVEPSQRGLGVGEALVDEVIARAQALSYSGMYLDTLESMTSARRIYEQKGFVRVQAYYENPLPSVVYYHKAF